MTPDEMVYNIIVLVVVLIGATIAVFYGHAFLAFACFLLGLMFAVAPSGDDRSGWDDDDG